MLFGGDHELRAPTIVLAAVLVFGCAPKGRDIRLERLDAQRRALDATFDRLEDRLVADQARVRFWQEMRERHESVSAIACAVQDEHAEEMASRRLPPVDSRQYQARVAAVREEAAERVSAATSGAGSGGGR